MDPRRGYELHSLFLGRRIRPFHLAVTIATAVVAHTLHDVTGGWAPTSPARILAYAAGISAATLTYGWWFRSDRAAAAGLLLASGVWASRAVYAALNGTGILVVNQWASVALSVAWTIGAAGAYLLERAELRLSDDGV